VPNLNDCWRMIWRHGGEPLQHASMCIDQHETRVIVTVGSRKDLNFRGAMRMSGTFDGHELSFSNAPGTATLVNFHGTLVNGMLVGTTDLGVSWLALRPFE
jgi:hypothetical protein